MAPVHPFDDPDVVAGQGTLGLELLDDLPDVTTVVVPVGGGGLAGGLSLWARERGDVRIVGVESSVSRAVSTAVATGRITEVGIGDGIADGILGNLEAGCVTPGLIGAGPVVLTSVTDAEIHAAMRWLFTEHGLVAEGSGACGVAAVLAGKVEISGRLVVVLSGRNIVAGTYAKALARDPGQVHS
jgi:threonine dehydratase